jgi:hypothetical protein
MVAAWMRAAAIRRGQPPPVVFEAEARPDYMSLTVDPEKIQPTEPPDPRLYRALPGGGYIYIPAEEVWNRDTDAIRRRQRNERRRARRKARREARKAAQADPIDITPPKPPDGKG